MRGPASSSAAVGRKGASGRKGAAVAKLQAAVMGAPQVLSGGPLFDAGSDLGRELVASPIHYRGCQRLEALGVEGRFVAELGAICAIGMARVHLSANGSRWEPGGPDARLLLAVMEGGELADIIAVSTAHPDQVARRTGFGWCLGDDRYELAERCAAAGRHVRLRVFADPLEWLRGRGEGICVIDWQQALMPLRTLGEAVTLECAPGLATLVRARLERGGLPLVAGPVAAEGLSLAERIGRRA